MRKLSHIHTLHKLTVCSAYEIARYWGETPPPPQILEDLTARGGDLRNRRLENYHQNSQTQAYDGGSDQHDEEEGQRTPVRSRQDAGIYADNKETTGSKNAPAYRAVIY